MLARERDSALLVIAAALALAALLAWLVWGMPFGLPALSAREHEVIARWVGAGAPYRPPAPLPAALSDSIRSLAIAAFGALDLAGMARVDFFVLNGSERVFLNEVNPLPGFTPISMYPKLWEATGLSYRELLTRLIELARERADEARHRLSRRGGFES